MKLLWLSAVTATCLLLGSVAHAGDHRHGGRHERHCDDDWRPRHEARYHHGGHYRPRYYRPAEVYYRPVHYRPAPVVPVVYEPVRAYRGDRIHGSITVGF